MNINCIIPSLNHSAKRVITGMFFCRILFMLLSLLIVGMVSGCVSVSKPSIPVTVVSTRYKIPKNSTITLVRYSGDFYGVEQAVMAAMEESGLDVMSDVVSNNVQRASGQNKILSTGEVSIDKESLTLYKTRYLCQLNIGFYYFYEPSVNNTTVKIIDLSNGKIILSMEAFNGTYSASDIKNELKKQLALVIEQ